jgi:hypothetical protein
MQAKLELIVRGRRCVRKDQYLSVLFLTKLASSEAQNGFTFLNVGIYFNKMRICLDVAWILQKYSHHFIAAS